MKRLIVAYMLVLVFPLNAQQDIIDRIAPDSRVVIERGIKLHDDKKYKAAAEEFRKISVNDTNYTLAQYELALSLKEDSLYEEAIAVLEGVKQIKSSSQPEIYSLLGSVYDIVKKYDMAVNAFQDGIAVAPGFYRLYFNLAVTYENMERWQDAFETYQKSLYYYPLHVASNIKLGVLCANAGLITESILCLGMAMLSNPDLGVDALAIMEQIALGNWDKEISLQSQPRVNIFEDIKIILLNKIALNKGYKLKTKYDYMVVRQLQAMFEKLTYDKNNPNFFNQAYVRLYEEIFKKSMFNGYVSYIFASVADETMSKEMKKNAAEATKFRTWLLANLEPLIADRTLQTASGREIFRHEYDDGYRLFAFGKMAEGGKLAGNWVLYHPNGFVRANMKFLNGSKDGMWLNFHDNGVVQDTLYFKADQRNGIGSSINRDGYLTQHLSYVQGKLEGPVFNYYPSGMVRNMITFMADTRSGPFKGYFPNGKLEENYIEGPNGAEGEYLEYYDNDTLYLRSFFKAGKNHGKSTYYYIHGGVMEETEYTNGQATGLSLSYHNNGQVRRKGMYQNNTSVGKWEIFDYNGALIEEQLLDESGKLNGMVREFSPDGKVLVESVYAKGDLQSYKCYDINGKLLREESKSKGGIILATYNARGDLLSEGLTVNGEKDGEWKHYHFNGFISALKPYKRGRLHGTVKEYYSNGNLLSEQEFKNGKEHGLGRHYYIDGGLKFLEYYIDGSLNGFIEQYNVLGKLTARVYYHDDLQHGESVYFRADGAIDEANNYYKGFYIGTTEYDSSGVAIMTTTLRPGQDTLKGYFFNGKPFRSVPYIGFQREGKAVWYHGNGQLSSEGSFLNNKRHGVWTWYHENGTVSYRTNYILGRTHGTVERYFPNGQLREITQYFMDKREGESISYFMDGKISVKRYYKNGLSNGRYVFHDPSGQVARIQYFEDDNLIAYSYLGKNGEESTPIPVNSRGAFTIVTYYQNGQKAWEIPLKDGMWHGIVKVWHPNGKLWRDMEFHFDEEHGAYKEYYDNGILKLDAVYYMGENHGYEKMYDAKGQLTEDSNYYLGNLHGETRIYKNNQLQKTTIYYHGEILVEK